MLHFDTLQEFRYDPKVKRYRVKDGVGKSQFISKEAFLYQTQKYLNAQKEALVSLADKVTDGQISLKDFQTTAAQHLKEINISAAIIGANGTENLNSEDYLIVARFLKTQYYSGKDPESGDRYGLKWLVKDIKDGKVSPAQLKARLELYSLSHKNIFWEMAARKSKKQFATRSLNSVVPCVECTAYASLPPKPIKEIILPTQKCTCKNRCKCTLNFMSLEEAIKEGYVP